MHTKGWAFVRSCCGDLFALSLGFVIILAILVTAALSFCHSSFLCHWFSSFSTCRLRIVGTLLYYPVYASSF